MNVKRKNGKKENREERERICVKIAMEKKGKKKRLNRRR
jgi:hypothetical protein